MKVKRALLILIISIAFIYGGTLYKHEKIKKIETEINPLTWIKIEKGRFYYGQFSKEKEINYDYSIMIAPVTNEIYAKYLNEALKSGKIKIENKKVFGYFRGEKFYGFRHELKIDEGNDYPYFLIDEPGVRISYENGKFIPDQGFENHPVVMVTWFGANGFCRFYGWDLPTEDEWEKSARGKDKRTYPWGEEISPEYANYNFSQREIREKVFGVKFQTTTPVGFFNGKTYSGYLTEDAKSGYGLYDMAGNVWEWVKDRYKKMSDRIMKGGSFRSYDFNLRVWARNYARPQYAGIDVGFRCVKRAEEVTKKLDELMYEGIH